MIRLLVLDIDDTIVETGKCVSPRNCKAIAAARAKGVSVSLATGRGFFGSRMVREQLHLTEPAINYGGSIIHDGTTGKVLYAKYLDSADVRTVFSAADRFGLHVQVYDGDTVVFRRENLFTERYTGYLQLPFRVDEHLLERPLTNVPKVLMYAPPEREAELLKEITKLLPSNLQVLCSKAGFLEVGETTVTKGTAVAWLANHLGVQQSEVAAIGDNTLDADMIEWAGIGCCVANGNPSVQAIADRILPSCAEDGVATFIEEIIL